jgi:glycosyltransferase involved in cell wall biosynthesis
LVKDAMARPLDVAIFIRAFEGGGAQRDAILLANALSRLGVSVAIVTLQPEGPFAQLVAPEVEVVPLRPRKLRYAFTALRGVLLARRPRAVLASEAAPNVLTYLAARSLPRATRPHILLREVASPSAARDGDPSLQGRLAYRLIGRVYRAASRVLVLATGARDDLIENFGVPAQKIHVMRSNAVIDPATEARLSKTAFEHPRERGLIVWVGRLSPEKDPLLAVEALSLLPASTGAHLRFVGDGTMKTAILARAAELGVADRVATAGHVSDPFQSLLAAELALCTSRFEGFGNAIVEALACGTPVVATDCPWGPREILQSGRYGKLVPIGDATGLAAAIVQTLDSPPDRAVLRERASRYTTDIAAREFIDVLDKLG